MTSSRDAGIDLPFYFLWPFLISFKASTCFRTRYEHSLYLFTRKIQYAIWNVLFRLPFLQEVCLLAGTFLRSKIYFPRPNFDRWNRMMRRTGKLYFLTICTAAAATTATISICFWNERTSTWHLWFDIVPQGFGMASLITTTLIVSL